MERHSYPLIFFLLSLGSACGGQASGVGSGTPTASFTVNAQVPAMGGAAGATYQRSVTFVASTCASTTIESCYFNPCAVTTGVDAGTHVPNVGPVSIDGAAMSPLTLVPDVDGTYVASLVQGQLPWTQPGMPITFQWAHSPDDSVADGGALTLSTPPYVTLTPGSAFADVPTTLARTQDLTVSWTNDEPPAEGVQLAVDLGSGSASIACIFDASAGTGVVPAQALAKLPAGAGTFNVHSKTSATLHPVDGTGWEFGFNVDAQARASYGLVKGSVAIQ